MDQASNPGSGQLAREAVEWLQRVKEDKDNGDRNIRVSILITEDHQRSLHQRLFALQLLEQTIKISWYQLSESIHLEVKLRLESWLSRDNLPESFLKDALSRCIVEVIMREWPQKWPNFLPLSLSINCNTSTLYVLWRLAEDVGIHFKPTNSTRRREILNMITSSLGQILGYISVCLQSSDRRINLLALDTLTSYLEWITVESSLIQFLCHILSIDPSNSDSFLIRSKMTSCDCLIAILSRKKYKDEELSAVLSIFSEKNLSSIIQVSRVCQEKIKVSGSFEFLDLAKRVSSLMTTAAKFAISQESLKKESCQTIDIMIKELFALLSHPNHSLSLVTIPFWKNFAKDPGNLSGSRGDEFVRQYFSLLSLLLKRLPQDHDFVVHEFDSFEDYETFFFRGKTDVLDILRHVTESKDQVSFDCCLQLLNLLFSNLKSTVNPKDCRRDWEVMAWILDAVSNRVPDPEKVTFSSSFHSLFLYPLFSRGYKLQSMKLMSKFHDPFRDLVCGLYCGRK